MVTSTLSAANALIDADAHTLSARAMLMTTLMILEDAILSVVSVLTLPP
ncbi:hypothetical protein GPA_00120 [Gordonibacter pamelaeae 7-10-1-b]|uniref:Uncharacterized protein n=1 Tax=Gordonibacter pamelaeae 7-10-1-b TaxID=657308 RepID=D6E685_9ACTN|nr:hypothetical protein GPA_00120 [Gordonibacter pamelaeae 7-10-1-b]